MLSNFKFFLASYIWKDKSHDYKLHGDLRYITNTCVKLASTIQLERYQQRNKLRIVTSKLHLKSKLTK